jgi:hypothetical protein
MENKPSLPESLLTNRNLHNLHFQETEFFSQKWKDKQIYIRQINYDGPAISDTWFALDHDTFELYLHFTFFGTKEDPRFIKLGTLPQEYTSAISMIADLEIEVLVVINYIHHNLLRCVETKEQFYEYYKKVRYKDGITRPFNSPADYDNPVVIRLSESGYVGTDPIQHQIPGTVEDLQQAKIFYGFAQASEYADQFNDEFRKAIELKKWQIEHHDQNE